MTKRKREDITKERLEKLYVHQGLNPREIAEALNCSHRLIERRLQDIGIPRREHEPRSLESLTPDILKRLYVEQGLSQGEIARMYHCSYNTIGDRLRQFGIPVRPRTNIKRPDITETLLTKLYLEQGLSQEEIGELLGCAGSTVGMYLERYNIPKRSLSESITIHPRADFSGDPVEKAYLIGFRLGDLHVKPTTCTCRSIEVSSKTSRVEQVELFRALFERYGYAYVRGPDKRGEYTLLCRLNLSFSFLLPKVDDVPEWIRNSRKCSAAFAAGYTDAEGSFYTFYYKSRNEWRSGFNIGSQDRNIIFWFHEWLLSIGAQCPKPIADERKSYREAVWQITVRRRSALLAIIEHFEPLLRQPKRRADMARVKANVLERNRKWETRRGRKT